MVRLGRMYIIGKAPVRGTFPAARAFTRNPAGSPASTRRNESTREIRRDRDRCRSGGRAAVHGTRRGGQAHAAGRAHPRRRYLHQRGLYPDQDDGRERAGGVPRAARQGLRGRDRRGAGGPRPRSRAQAQHRRELPRRQPAPASRARNGLDLVFGEARFTGPRTVAVDGRRRRWATWSSSTPGAARRRRDVEGLAAVAAARLDLHHGARPRPRAPHRARRRIHRARVRPDVPPVRQPGHDRATGRPSSSRWRTRTWPPRCSACCARTAWKCCSRLKLRCAERLDGGVRVTVRTSAGDRPVVGSHVLLAAGRVPNTDRLDPKAAGIDTDSKGFIRVNERLETSAAGVYALGDVKGGPAFTHISYDDYRIIRDNLLHGRTRDTTDASGAVHRVHGPPARPRRPDRAGGAEGGSAVPGRDDADELRGSGAGDGRAPRAA